MMVMKNNLVSNEMDIQSTHKTDKNNNNRHKQQQNNLSNGCVSPTTCCVCLSCVLSFAGMNCVVLMFFL